MAASVAFMGCSKDEEEPNEAFFNLAEAKEKSELVYDGEASEETGTGEVRHAILSHIPEGTYEIPDDKVMEKVYYKHEISRNEFHVEYYVFTNQHHPNGYVIISEFSVLRALESDENVIEGELFTIPESRKPAHYIALVDNNIQGITLEVRQPDGYGPSGFKPVFLKEAGEKYISWFRTAEAVIIASMENPNFGEADVREAGQRMEGRETGIPR